MAKPPDGYASMIASIWFFSGLVILFQGIQGNLSFKNVY
jgi:hypothetical protein